MFTVLLVIHVFIAIGLIVLVLIQHGKGADAGAAFGSGSSATVFGSQGSASFLTRLTAVLATGFFITSLSLAYFTREAVKEGQDTSIGIPAEEPAAQIPDVPETPVDADMPAAPVDADTPAAPKTEDAQTGSPDVTQIPE
jgi:preprotein translocase subunit SecG